MKIYTKHGDEGFTSLLGGSRTRKDDPRIVALGEVDSLNSTIGWVLSATRAMPHIVITSALEPVQAELFILGARLAAMGTTKEPMPLPDSTIERMERDIDMISEDLEPLTDFVLPGGCELACRLHIARTVARRAEREVVHLLNPRDETLLHDPTALRYLNRLNDLLFVLARLANRDAGEGDIHWHGHAAAKRQHEE